MFTDMDRGTALYGEDNYEAKTLGNYLPTPMSGLFGGGETTPVDCCSDAQRQN